MEDKGKKFIFLVQENLQINQYGSMELALNAPGKWIIVVVQEYSVHVSLSKIEYPLYVVDFYDKNKLLTQPEINGWKIIRANKGFFYFKEIRELDKYHPEKNTAYIGCIVEFSVQDPNGIVKNMYEHIWPGDKNSIKRLFSRISKMASFSSWEAFKLNFKNKELKQSIQKLNFEKQQLQQTVQELHNQIQELKSKIQ